MTTGSQLKRLLAAYRDRDDLSFRRTAVEIIEQEEAKKHTQLAHELRRLLSASGTGSPVGAERLYAPTVPMDREGELALATIKQPERKLSELVLDSELSTSIEEVVREVSYWSALDRQAVPRTQKLLFHGPPGCGKTSAAESIAGELGWPLATVRIDTIVSSYLGETGSNLRRVFEYAAEIQTVLLFDEFDAIGKVRDDPSDHGELRRVVNAVLQLMDEYVGPSLLIGATNYEGGLDPTIWRRFDAVLYFPPPNAEQLQIVLFKILRGSVGANVNLREVAESLVGLPHAAAESLAFSARRRAIVSGRETVEELDVASALVEVTNRKW